MTTKVQRFLLAVLIISVTSIASAQSIVCSACPGNYPTVNFTVYYPSGAVKSANIPIYVGPGTTNTVRQVMMVAPCQFGALAFTYTASCPFGTFVNTINGVSPGSSYWELVINGQPANCGMDTCAVSAGATVYWYVPSSSASEKNAHASFSDAQRQQSHQYRLHKAKK
jgi:hypothetical protein